MKTIVDVGTTTLGETGGVIIMKAPREWLSKYRLEIGMPVFSVPTLDGEIRWHLKKSPGTRKRRLNVKGYLSVSRDDAGQLNLKKGDTVRLEVDTVHGILIMRKADGRGGLR